VAHRAQQRIDRGPVEWVFPHVGQAHGAGGVDHEVAAALERVAVRADAGTAHDAL